MPYISQSFIDDLPNQVNIVDLINKRLPLKKMGSNYRAPCPFHGGKNPNFSVSSSKQFYHCFKCGESGGAIKFMQNFEHLNFVEAIETLAKEFGLSVVYDKNSKPEDTRLSRYRALLEKVGEFYIHQLKTSAAKNKAVNYAKARGISGEIAKRFALGFATPSKNDLYANFKDSEQNITDLKALGLLKVGQYGEYDFFRNRLMFPIHNAKGNIIAFGGRAFDKSAKAKYLNSSESPVFAKSKELYGLYYARKHSNSMDYILVVEGYMDVVALHQAGITSVVATLGTATTAQHLQILARSTREVIFCFDGDQAGIAAAWKALKIALPIMKAGLLMKFLFLPDGEDPDSLVKKESGKAFEARISKAYTLSKFLFKHLKDEVDFATIEGKTAFLEKASALIFQVKYRAYQQQLIEGMAKMVKQTVAQVETVFNQYTADAQSPFESPATLDQFEPLEVADYMDFEGRKSTLSSAGKKNNLQALMGRMIRLVLNYPTLVDDTVEVRIREIEKSQVLLELARSAQLDEDISQTDLIKPFANKPGIYQRLQALCVLEPHLSEKQAREEFLSTLSLVEKRQKNAKIKASISQANSREEQQKIMQAIQQDKSQS